VRTIKYFKDIWDVHRKLNMDNLINKEEANEKESN
jgi:hypothetical protein